MSWNRLKVALKQADDVRKYFLYPNKISVFYHDIQNFGDQLTPYLLEKILRKETFILRARKHKYLMGVGSVIHFANQNAYLWGTGILDPEMLTQRAVNIEPSKILALRGELTKKYLEDYTHTTIRTPLGDPALTLPKFFTPKVSERKFRLGLVPHYVDYQFCVQLAQKYADDSIKVVDVSRDVETVINEIASCDYILSSSLHGLIISDAYEIPNLWVRFTNNLIGGEFKFFDYYSTTSNISPTSHSLTSPAILDDFISKLGEKCVVSDYKYEPDLLIAALKKYAN